MTQIVWFTGMSGAGKTTLSNMLYKALIKDSISVNQIDGDLFRSRENNTVLNQDNIIENNLKIINEIENRLNNYQYVLVSVISPFNKIREYAKNKWGKNYIEVFVNCDLNTLIKRDTKNLYKKYFNGELTNLVGMSEIPYEKPSNPNLIINSDIQKPNDSLRIIMNYITNHSLKNYPDCSDEKQFHN